MAETQLFFGGLPYTPDVNKLIEAFPVPTMSEGRTLSHNELTGVLNLKRDSRYYGVINAWRKKLRDEFRVIVEWDRNNGLVVLDPAKCLTHRERGVQQKGRLLGRSVNRLAHDVDRTRLDDTGKSRFDHVLMAAAKMKQAAQLGSREMAVELAPVKSLPKPKIPKPPADATQVLM